MLMNKVEKNTLSNDSNFVVKESRTVNLVFGILLLILSAIILYHIAFDYHRDQMMRYKKMLSLSLVPALFFMLRAYMRRELFLINKSGIYRCNALVTNWNNFIKANITQEAITGSYQDNFVLIIEFYKKNEEGYFVRKMKLPNTMDKSEEEILEAIRYFSQFSNRYVIQSS